jgi:hypothetical protein
MQFYPHRTVEEQASRLPFELRQAYQNSQLDRITIFDGTDELEITGYAEYSYLDEKSYKTQPVRTEDGAIQEIEEYATFLTPRLVIKYNMMNIEDYRAIMKMFKKQNGFIVKCYDVVEDKIVRNEMYVAPPSMPIIYQQYLIALGIQEYAIEMIGTNVPTNPDNIKDGTPIISFTVGSQSFETNRGRIWEDFVDTSNADWVYIYEDGYVYNAQSYHPLTHKGKYVKADDYIYADYAY